MNNKILIYSGIIIAFIAFFISGYFVSYLFPKEQIGASQKTLTNLMDTDTEGQVLRPAKNSYLILGEIGEIDKDKSPLEMVFYVDLRLSFLNAGFDMIERKILIEEDTLIYVGPNLEFGETSKEERVLASVDELNKGSMAIINTKEMVSLILEQDVFTAQEIKVFVSQEEYQNYLK